MQELIYRFLLEAGFSRASLISLAEPVSPLPGTLYAPAIPSSAANNKPAPQALDSTEKYRRFFYSRKKHKAARPTPPTPPARVKDGELKNPQPAYLVVDPETADLLSVIAVVESDADEILGSHHETALQYAAHAGDGHTQTFLIHVHSDAESQAERVHFYHSTPSKQLQTISAYAFPDLDTMRAHRVHSTEIERRLRATERVEPVPSVKPSSPGRVYFLAVVLILMALADGWQHFQHGVGLFSITQVLLVISAFGLLAAPVLSLRYRGSAKRR